MPACHQLAALQWVVGAHSRRERELTRQREEQEAAKPRRALRWAQQAGLQGTDSHQQSRSQSGSGNPSGDMSASHSHEWQNQSALMVSALCFSTKGTHMQRSAPFARAMAMAAAIAGIISSAVSASVQQAQLAELGPYVSRGKGEGRGNRRAPGAHKSAQRAAMKLRRVKKHKARCK